MEISLREALALGDNYIGAQHIALALLGMNSGAVPPILWRSACRQPRCARRSSTAVARRADAGALVGPVGRCQPGRPGLLVLAGPPAGHPLS